MLCFMIKGFRIFIVNNIKLLILTTIFCVNFCCINQDWFINGYILLSRYVKLDK